MIQDWFGDAKLGIFIHWGIYAVKGVSESWSFHNHQISYEDYMSQLDGFTAEKWDADEWASLFHRAGAKYAVMTTKHHDGVALWDTKANDLSTVKKTPAARDLVTPYVNALRDQGLKVGLYYSHLDWSHPDYAVFENPNPGKEFNEFCHWDQPTDWGRWEIFLKFHHQQLEELCTEFGDVDLMWFDGDWERSSEDWRFEHLIHDLNQWQPEMVINSRVWGKGDYKTPEQGIPIVPPTGPWEFCVTMNDSWGWQVGDNNYKSSGEIIQMFCETIGMGGNMLLDIGPHADGTIPAEQVERLEALGAWLGRNGEGVYRTKAGLPHGHFAGPSTLSKSGSTLYLFVYGDPKGTIMLKGLQSQVRRISVLGTEEELGSRKLGGAEWNRIPGVLWIDPPEQLDADVTVLRLELDGKVELYREAGGAVEQN
jgi:alpha-L-fucosidase